MIRRNSRNICNILISIIWFTFFLTLFCYAEMPVIQKRSKELKEIPIPIIHVKGSHYEVGYQLGTKLKKNSLGKLNE